MTELTNHEILALRAVAYGANTNRKLVGGEFCVNINNPDKMEMIPFYEAIEIVYSLIDKFEKGR